MLAGGIQLHYMINYIGEIFTILVVLEILISNTSLATNWNKYYNILKSYSHVPDNVDLVEDRFYALFGAAENITTNIMNDDIVQKSLQNLFLLRKSLVDKNCTIIATEFSQYLKHAIASLDKLVTDQPNVNNMYKCIKINALFVLNSHLFGNMDQKIFKSLIELDIKVTINFIGKITNSNVS